MPHVRRGGPLKTVGQVIHELGKVYRAARRGDISPQDGTRLAFILTAIRQAIESGDIEHRVRLLEDQTAREIGGDAI